MRLSRKLACLKVPVQAQTEAATPASTFWTGERIERWQQWAQRILETMPYERGKTVLPRH